MYTQKEAVQVQHSWRGLYAVCVSEWGGGEPPLKAEYHQRSADAHCTYITLTIDRDPWKELELYFNFSYIIF